MILIAVICYMFMIWISVDNNEESDTGKCCITLLLEVNLLEIDKLTYVPDSQMLDFS